MLGDLRKIENLSINCDTLEHSIKKSFEVVEMPQRLLFSAFFKNSFDFASKVFAIDQEDVLHSIILANENPSGPCGWLGRVCQYIIPSRHKSQWAGDNQYTALHLATLIAAQLIDVLMLPDLFVGFGFDLADALSRDAEFFSDFFEGVGYAV